MAASNKSQVVDMSDIEIATHIAEKLYDEVPLDVCESGCVYYEESSTTSVCSLGVFEESMCPPVRAKLVQTRDQINMLIAIDMKSLFDLDEADLSE